jgi:hypothetical protein
MKDNKVFVLDPQELASQAERFRTETLFAEEGSTVLSPEAEQHYLLALAALETAERHFMLAHYAVIKNR